MNAEAHVMETTPRSLTADDRCDRCGAQAYVAMTYPKLDPLEPPSELLWCAHHADKFGLVPAIDERYKLLHRPTNPV